MVFKIVIPSKDRLKVLATKTLEFLAKTNLLYECEIYIFVNIDNFKQYSKYFNSMVYENIIIILGDDGLNAQRNCIRKYFDEGEQLLILDDDLDDIRSLQPIPNLYEYLDECFKKIKDNKILLGSINPTNNKYYCTNQELQGLYFCVGCFYLEINNHNPYLLLDTEETSEKEDYIRTIKHYNLSGAVARFNGLCVKHRYNGSLGGMNHDNHNRILDNVKMINILANKYKNILIKKKTKSKIELQFRANTKIFKKLVLDKKYNIENGKWIKGCNIKLDDRNYKIYDKTNGKLIAVLLKNCIDKPKNMIELDKLIKYSNTNRGNIAGKLTYDRLPNCFKQHTDKNLSNLVYTNKEQTRGYINNGINRWQICNEVKSITVGNSYYRGKCINNALTKKNENMIEKNFSYFFSQVSNLYKRYVPDNIDVANKWMDTEFTGVTVNKSVRSATHEDVNNLGWSAIYKYKSDDPTLKNIQSGSELLFPEYDLEISLTDKDLLIFDSSKVKHANPPMVVDGNRYHIYNDSNVISLVFFKSKFFKKNF